MSSQIDTVPTTPRLLGRKKRTPGKSRGAMVASGLSADVVQDSARRLSIVGLLFTAAGLVGLVVQEILRALGIMSNHMRLERFISSAAAIALGLLAYAYARRWRGASPSHLIFAGLVFEIVGGFLVVYPEALHHVLFPSLQGQPIGISWLVVWIAVYPVVLPASPPITVLAGLVTASMAPLAVWIAASFGHHPWPSTSSMAFFIVPCYTIALLTSVPAALLHRMRREVSEARALGSYRLEQRLGGGGMGEVWRASHRMLARPAAIKLIRAEVTAGATALEREALERRFELEAQTTASLSSPHTVALYDFGISDDGRFFYVMELLDGVDLERLVHEHGPLPVERAVHLLLAACESLAEAHERGLVHRDVKPSNLYACRLGGRHDVLKVLDFGLVSAPRGTRPAELKLTMTDMTIGTPTTMAPEMVLGQPSDRRVDLYALGCVAFWLVTGREVFEGRSSVELMSQHAHSVPERPSRFAGGGLPPEMEAVILACLEKDPERRPPSATALAERLAAVPLASSWSEARAAEWWRSHRPVPPSSG